MNLTNHFQLLPGIREQSEKKIVAQGIHHWNSFIATPKINGISEKRKYSYNRILMHAKKALASGDTAYFIPFLKETWLLYPYFKDESVFLDIEAADKNITVIGLFDGIQTKTMIRDVNLDIAYLKKELSKYKLMLTFNGSSFDLPRLKKHYPHLLPCVPHIDLCHVCRKLGLVGGLKTIEKGLGIQRMNRMVERLHCGDPAQLWRMFKGSGDDYYLKLLVEYNEEDVINLKQIVELVTGQLNCSPIRRCSGE
jgi:uncharacterized protein